MIGIARDPATAFEFRMESDGQWQPHEPVNDTVRQLAAALDRHSSDLLERDYGPSKGEPLHFAFLRTVEDLGLEEVKFVPPSDDVGELIVH